AEEPAPSPAKSEPQTQIAQANTAPPQDVPQADALKADAFKAEAPQTQEALKAPEPEISVPEEPRPIPTQAPAPLAEPNPTPEQSPVSEPAPVAEPAPVVEPAQKPQAAPRRPVLPPSLARPLPDAPEVQFLPDAFRVIATDQEPGLSARDNETYKALVFERLIAAKLYPAAARQRRAKGIALVNFMLDSAGRVAGVSLIRSSGDADLDREALAMVNRAAPYPPPPSGAVRLFSPLIEFGSED
ncbi:MAG: TonB family protein, partial [Alphaproteobacteria bacterium]|nr:TonB family protein [Alphaproteobacteria bacterium]